MLNYKYITAGRDCLVVFSPSRDRLPSVLWFESTGSLLPWRSGIQSVRLRSDWVSTPPSSSLAAPLGLSFCLSSTNSAMRPHRLSHPSLISVCRPTCVSQQPPRRILLGRRSSVFKFSSTLEKIVAALEIKVTHKKKKKKWVRGFFLSPLQSVHFSWRLKKKKQRKWVACGGVQLPLATLLPPNELTFPFSLCATKIHQFVHAYN